MKEMEATHNSYPLGAPNVGDCKEGLLLPSGTRIRKMKLQDKRLANANITGLFFFFCFSCPRKYLSYFNKDSMP
jgi:hypothetical protein